MRVAFHRTFRKQFKKLPLKFQEAFESRLETFIESPFVSELNNHPLSGEWKTHRSINVTGDIRAIYFPEGRDSAFFVAIGTHHELYGS